MGFWQFIIFPLILISFYSSWKNYNERFKKAEDELDIRNALVPFLLMIFLFILAIAVFIF